jgi:hypothetical protein
VQRFLFPTAILLLAAGLTAACSANDDSGEETPVSASPTAVDAQGASAELEAYYIEIQAIGDNFLAALAATPGEIDPAAPLQEQADLYEVFAAGFADEIREARDAVLALEAPAEVTEGHEELVASIENALLVAERLEAEFAAVQTIQDLQALAADPDAAAALVRFNTACASLRDLGVVYDVSTQLPCR